MSAVLHSRGVRAWLNYPEAAEYLGLSVRQLKRVVASRRVRHYKLGGHHVSFDVSDLDAYLASCLVPLRTES